MLPRENNRVKVALALIMLLCVVVLNIPTALIGSFQETVGTSEEPLVLISAINSSIIYMLFMVAVVAIIAMVWKNKIAKAFVIVLSVVAISATQGLNWIVTNNYAQLKNSVLDREEIFQTETVQYMAINGIFAQDIYRTTGSIGTTRNDWQAMLENKELPVYLTEQLQQGSSYLKYDFLQRQFWISSVIDINDGAPVADQLTLLSRQNHYGDTVLMQCVDGSYRLFELTNAVEDNGFYVYYIDTSGAQIFTQQSRIIESTF